MDTVVVTSEGYKAFRLDRILKFIFDLFLCIGGLLIIWRFCSGILQLINAGVIKGELLSDAIESLFTLLVYIAGLISGQRIKK